MIEYIMVASFPCFFPSFQFIVLIFIIFSWPDVIITSLTTIAFLYVSRLATHHIPLAFAGHKVFYPATAVVIPVSP